LDSGGSRYLISSLINFHDVLSITGTCTLILGRRFGFLDGEVSETATRLADSVTSQFRASQEAFYGLPLWKLIPTKAYKEFVASEDALYEQVQLVDKLKIYDSNKRFKLFEFSIVSEIVDTALIDEEQSCTDVRSVFVSILQVSELDNRDKKAAIIDYIAAGIKTVIYHNMSYYNLQPYFFMQTTMLYNE